MQNLTPVRRACGVLALLVTSASSASAQQAPIDWPQIEAETIRHFRALVQIDTSNPPGNEIKAVEYLEKVLAAEGIASKILALDPNRPNLVARLKGTGSKRPLLLLAHTDTVGVQRDEWPVDPFGAVQRNGYVWGRGTSDDNDNLAANLMAFVLLKRSGAKLDRDLIFLAEAACEGYSGLRHRTGDVRKRLHAVRMALRRGAPGGGFAPPVRPFPVDGRRRRRRE